ncbi:hypothetical protein COW36_16070 [bacterium (Candidatus Blackallbacteria) CG17_big_fil_post_rev_8_21_14_2_50_48_46]|uniref:Uncharacterized protein n=1 Tax=bacterium (Candidatus Blackallbacteria) CG17_big_fil_post_rev_8_21_14_2_50_48_46 TaxID=2014261 RepID=A0A2M7G1W0_9BACT|nr:MAG: hypothetical protein COW64_08595 [bacterium (Candidatus Blackallbacteria) CG18_big_fil_WC_8_21_14_2_50_49_26]PIW15719.1 MAG: hypothetical protein COW36_16070 [bacterium (Candidatus Blackallbacteria) CG17_big_fil_post_rev_8_21_14_2_50_48_46]PIW49221.1 MAG: hypothetical protein COW20_06580 [bacterium (Candidatus Blackallbacteria) CG13_big_fil_rev_8_21_14_2_50_49_14]
MLTHCLNSLEFLTKIGKANKPQPENLWGTQSAFTGTLLNFQAARQKAAPQYLLPHRHVFLSFGYN